jgi:hypothetical protein
MNLNIQEEKERISTEVRGIQENLQRNKQEEQELIEELLKRKGQLELLENLGLDEKIHEDK